MKIYLNKQNHILAYVLVTILFVGLTGTFLIFQFQDYPTTAERIFFWIMTGIFISLYILSLRLLKREANNKKQYMEARENDVVISYPDVNSADGNPMVLPKDRIISFQYYGKVPFWMWLLSPYSAVLFVRMVIIRYYEENGKEKQQPIGYAEKNDITEFCTENGLALSSG